jgi:hypothetical protein
MTLRRLAAAAGLSFLLGLGSLGANPAGLRSLASLAGLSGKLRAVFALPHQQVPGTQTLARKPGIYDLARSVGSAFHLIVLTPFSAKVGGRIGAYRLGRWPFEGRGAGNPVYDTPKGFIEVTPQNLGVHVSDHFTLGQFVTKDQFEVWPKYVVLDGRLLDKLELTIEELRRTGHPVAGLFVMSGFRTPEYNERGVGAGGRSAVSRHQYGDAADVYPDDRGRGIMDDLNGDGRVDLADARILAQAAERVEEMHPELAGGIGIYPANGVHGPFVHIDARGKRARWGAPAE